MGLNKTGTGAGTTDTLPMAGETEDPVAGFVNSPGPVTCSEGFT